MEFESKLYGLGKRNCMTRRENNLEKVLEIGGLY